MLVGTKTFLRRLEAEDLEQTLIWINDVEIFVTMGVFGPRNKRQQEIWYANVFDSKDNIIFSVIRSSDKKHIGNASLFDIDYRNRNCGLTIMLPEREVRGHGYGTDAVHLLCKYAFDYLNLHKVYCKTDNPFAEKLYQSLGFVKEGILRQQSFGFGKYVDKAYFGLLKSEYQTVVSQDGLGEK